MSAQPKTRYTLEEYLALDRESPERLEYWNGEIFDMSGVEPEHDAVEGNLYLALRARLEPRGCRVFLANIRIKVPSAPPYRYADLSALCGEPQYEAIGGIQALTNPSLLIEALSDSTEAYDRGAKFTHYKSIPAFSEYLLVDPRTPNVTHLTREGDGRWTHREYTQMDEIIKLSSVDAEISLREIYQGVVFQPFALSRLRPIAPS